MSFDLVPDEVSLARAQLASGLATVAEATLRRRIARLEVEGPGGYEEIDEARALLAQAIWRQGRPVGAGAVIDRIRASSPERRTPVVLLMEAEASAAAGQAERANAQMERVLSEIGVDEAWRLRAGTPSRLSWPVPVSLRARRPPPPAVAPPPEQLPQRTAAGHARLEGARMAYGAGEHERGDRELALAVRLDPELASEGIALLEPTLGRQPPADRLVLYGDLLRAVGRQADASVAYDRAAGA
ncbi:MAG: hypothetical protein ACR2KI_07455 [Candidatus Limnocylindria bacterium]